MLGGTTFLFQKLESWNKYQNDGGLIIYKMGRGYFFYKMHGLWAIGSGNRKNTEKVVSQEDF
jgi:hypothetical protein